MIRFWRQTWCRIAVSICAVVSAGLHLRHHPPECQTTSSMYSSLPRLDPEAAHQAGFRESRCDELASAFGHNPGACPSTAGWSPPLEGQNLREWTQLCCEHVLPDRWHNGSCTAPRDVPTLRRGDTRRLLLMFTVLDDREDEIRQLAQRNSLHALAALQRQHPADAIAVIAFVESDRWDFLRDQLGVYIERLPSRARNLHGTPILREMVRAVLDRNQPWQLARAAQFYCYFNSDMLFDASLVHTLAGVSQSMERQTIRQRVLVTGQRLHFYLWSNFVLNETNTYPRAGMAHGTENRADPVASLQTIAQPGGSAALDYFIFTESTFDWAQIPDFVIGRVGYDNCLVHRAASCALLDVIDASSTLNAFHQSDHAGNTAASHRNVADKAWNMVRCPLHYLGTLDVLPLRTVWLNNGADVDNSLVAVSSTSTFCSRHALN
jgi:hypothetical protein